LLAEKKKKNVCFTNEATLEKLSWEFTSGIAA
jgi:hypothetical protein